MFQKSLCQKSIRVAEATQQELFVFTAAHPQQLMDGREGTEALAPFIKSRQPLGACWQGRQMRTIAPAGGVRRVGALEEAPGWSKRTEATYI